MIVNENDRRMDVVANGVTVDYPVDFSIINENDVAVYVNGALTTAYSIAGEGNEAGFTITFNAPPANLALITIIGGDVAEQASRYTTIETLPLTRIENDFSHLIQLFQQVLEVQNRTLRAPLLDNLNMVLPSLTGRKDRVLGFDTNGLPTAVPLPGAAGGDVSLATVIATGAITARSLATRFNDLINVKDYGTSGDGVSNDTVAVGLAIAAAAGKILLFPAGVYLIDAISISVSNILFIGANATIRASAASFDIFTLGNGISDIEFKDLRFEGAASSNATGQYAIMTDSAGNARIRISNCIFSGIDSSKGLNNGIKFNIGSINCWVTDSYFERLWGTIAGTGYGVLCAGTKIHIRNNSFLGTANRGRHGVYLSAGAAYCQVTDNVIDGFNSAGINLNSSSTESADHHNIVAFNTINGGNTVTASGAINLSGKNNDNIIIGNFVETSGKSGIRLDGSSDIAGLSPARNQIINNHIMTPQEEGVIVLGALNTIVAGNRIHGASAAGASQTSSIDIRTDGTVNADQTAIFGNYIIPGANTRSAVRLNQTSPEPTKTRIGINYFAKTGWTISELELDTSLEALHFSSGVSQRRVLVTYSASMAIDASRGNYFEIGVTNGTAFTINSPTNGSDGESITINIRNGSGGALGAVTWGALYKMSTWTSPANTFNRSITFTFNGTNWYQVNPAGVDVPN